MENLTIHNLPPELAQALERESMRLQASLDQTVIELLRRALRAGSSDEQRNGLASLAGTWTDEEHARFEAAVAPVVDLIDRAEWLGVPSIVLGELWIGFLLGDRVEKNQTELNAFLAHPPVEELRARHEVIVSLPRPAQRVGRSQPRAEAEGRCPGEKGDPVVAA